MDGVGAGDQALAARYRHLQAEHGDDADLPARVGVRGLEAARLIAAPLAALDQNIADVADIAQAVAERTLRQLAAEMGAETAEDEAELVVAIAAPVETAEHEESAAGRDLLAHPLKLVGHRDEREFFPRHRRVIGVAAAQAAPRRRSPRVSPATTGRSSPRSARGPCPARRTFRSDDTAVGMSLASPPIIQAQLVLHHLLRPFAGSITSSLLRFHAQIIDDLERNTEAIPEIGHARLQHNIRRLDHP